MNLEFRVEARDGAARLGRFRTRHGEVRTPVFMPVGTRGSVKGVSPRDLDALGVRILLGNSYHLYLRPGHEVVRRLGGLRRFMSFSGSILTDSGGFQVLSLAPLRELSEEGVRFRSHLDGSLHLLTPETVMEVQDALDSDIAMPLDVCLAADRPREELDMAVDRSLAWLRRSVKARVRPDEQALFGIVQGGVDSDLRRRSADETVAIDLDGYAIGGLAVGEERGRTFETVALVAPRLPEDRPRYLMGMGTPRDLVEAVALGVDLFDSVLPTRTARNATLFTSSGRLNLRNAVYKCDERPLDEACRCSTCAGFSRAYLRHLVLAGEILAPMLLTVHNLHHYLDTMERIRQSISAQRFDELRREVLAVSGASAAAS